VPFRGSFQEKNADVSKTPIIPRDPSAMFLRYHSNSFLEGACAIQQHRSKMICLPVSPPVQGLFLFVL
jgi:hypothetical protein